MSCFLFHDWMGWSKPQNLNGLILQQRQCRDCFVVKVREVKPPPGWKFSAKDDAADSKE